MALVSLVDEKRDLIPLTTEARRLRVSSKWLREEAEAGRIPALRAGKTFLVHPPSVEAALIQRAKGEEDPK